MSNIPEIPSDGKTSSTPCPARARADRGDSWCATPTDAGDARNNWRSRSSRMSDTETVVDASLACLSSLSRPRPGKWSFFRRYRAVETARSTARRIAAAVLTPSGPCTAPRSTGEAGAHVVAEHSQVSAPQWSGHVPVSSARSRASSENGSACVSSRVQCDGKRLNARAGVGAARSATSAVAHATVARRRSMADDGRRRVRETSEVS